MISSWFSLCIFYFTSIFFFFSSNTFISFWIVMELNLVSFLMVIFFSDGKSQEYHTLSLYYFILQSVGSLLFLAFVLHSFLVGFYMPWLFTLSIIFKIGLFPFSFWVFKVGSVMGNLPFYFLLVLQKIPLFLLLFGLGSSGVFLVCLFSFVFGSVMIFFSGTLQDMLISSSISSTFWVMLLFYEGITCFLLFFLFYGIILAYVLLGAVRSNFLFFSSSPLKVFQSAIPFMFLSGLPPVSLFFFKLNIMSVIFNFSGGVGMFFFWIFSVLGLFGYFKFFYKNLLFVCFMYLNHNFHLKMMSLGVGSLLGLLPFLM